MPTDCRWAPATVGLQRACPGSATAGPGSWPPVAPGTSPAGDGRCPGPAENSWARPFTKGVPNGLAGKEATKELQGRCADHHSHRPLRVIFVHQRIPDVDEPPVTEILRDMSLKESHHLRVHRSQNSTVSWRRSASAGRGSAAGDATCVCGAARGFSCCGGGEATDSGGVLTPPVQISTRPSSSAARR